VTIVLPFFCEFNYVYAVNYPLRMEWARLTQNRARTARAAVDPDPSLACPRPRFEVRKRPFCPSSTVAARLPWSDDRRKPRHSLQVRKDRFGQGSGSRQDGVRRRPPRVRCHERGASGDPGRRQYLL